MNQPSGFLLPVPALMSDLPPLVRPPLSEWSDWPLAWDYDPEEYDFDELQTHLWSAAKLMYQEATARHADGTRVGKHIAALSMGTAVELVAKAFLVGINPALIVPQGDVNSILIFSGNVEYLPTGAKAKTRTGNDVLTIARRLIQTESGNRMPWTDADQETVLEARNATAHLGLLRDQQKIDFMECGNRIIFAISAQAGDLGDYWPEIRP